MKNQQLIKKMCPKYPILISLLSLGISFPLLLSSPVSAAEKVYFVYDSIQESLKVSSLENFVETGNIDKNLSFYFKIANVSEEEKAIFKDALTKKIDVDPIVLSRLLKTDEGNRLLDFFGKIINIQGGRNGKLALRGAIVTAALDKQEGLTLLNFLRQLSVNVQIDLKRAISFAKDIEIIVNGTEKFVDKVEKLSAKEAQQNSEIDFEQLPDIRMINLIS